MRISNRVLSYDEWLKEFIKQYAIQGNMTLEESEFVVNSGSDWEDYYNGNFSPEEAAKEEIYSSQ